MTPASYPSQPVTFVSAAPPGGGWYQLCEHTIRVIQGERLAPVDVKMEQRKGAVELFEEMATKRVGDANTIVAFSPGMTIQLLNAKSKYTYKDVTPIGATSTDYGVLVVRADSQIRELGDLLKLLKKAPQPVGGGQPVGFMHDAIVRTVTTAAGLDKSSFQYMGSKNPAEAIASLTAGNVVVSAMGAANVTDELRSGKVRVLAVLSEKRIPGDFKNIPTAIEQGCKATFPMWRGFYGAKGMPDEARAFWENTFTRLAGTKTWAKTLDDLGWFPFLLAGKRFADFLERDTAQYKSPSG